MNVRALFENSAKGMKNTNKARSDSFWRFKYFSEIGVVWETAHKANLCDGIIGSCKQFFWLVQTETDQIFERALAQIFLKTAQRFPFTDIGGNRNVCKGNFFVIVAVYKGKYTAQSVLTFYVDDCESRLCFFWYLPAEASSFPRGDFVWRILCRSAFAGFLISWGLIKSGWMSACHSGEYGLQSGGSV